MKWQLVLSSFHEGAVVSNHFDTRESNDDSKPVVCCNHMQGFHWPQEELIWGGEVRRDQAGACISGWRESQRAATAVLQREEVCFYLTMH